MLTLQLLIETHFWCGIESKGKSKAEKPYVLDSVDVEDALDSKPEVGSEGSDCVEKSSASLFRKLLFSNFEIQFSRVLAFNRAVLLLLESQSTRIDGR